VADRHRTGTGALTGPAPGRCQQTRRLGTGDLGNPGGPRPAWMRRRSRPAGPFGRTAGGRSLAGLTGDRRSRPWTGRRALGFP